MCTFTYFIQRAWLEIVTRRAAIHSHTRKAQRSAGKIVLRRRHFVGDVTRDAVELEAKASSRRPHDVTERLNPTSTSFHVSDIFPAPLSLLSRNFRARNQARIHTYSMGTRNLFCWQRQQHSLRFFHSVLIYIEELFSFFSLLLLLRMAKFKSRSKLGEFFAHRTRTEGHRKTWKQSRIGNFFVEIILIKAFTIEFIARLYHSCFFISLLLVQECLQCRLLLSLERECPTAC